ncbi:MAG: hypothetical protein KBD60_11510 [Sterolibacterium sp.]|jgi:hypothetical protein|nr:hypothetical protein [Sterolibacterium sp.]
MNTTNTLNTPQQPPPAQPPEAAFVPLASTASAASANNRYEAARDEVQNMFRKVAKDPVNQALYKAVLEYRLEQAR